MHQGDYEMPTLKTKMLIVDDEPSTRLLMSHIFRELGYEVRTAEDGFAALVEIRQDCPDMILSDLNMPGMSGFELLSVVRRRFPAIRVVAMSGAFSGDAVQPGVAADAFYEKATTLHGLLQDGEGHASTRKGRHSGGQSDFAYLDPALWGWAGEDASVTVSCPECLRTFDQMVTRASGIVHIYTTDCVHCNSPIYYAIVQAINGSAPQAFQRKPIILPPQFARGTDVN